MRVESVEPVLQRLPSHPTGYPDERADERHEPGRDLPVAHLQHHQGGASLLRVHHRRASVPVDTAQLAGTEVPRLRTIATERLLGQAQRDVAR